MNTLNCMIVDDELMARKALERLCTKHDALKVVSICENIEQALAALTSSEIDLVFLDVEMPGGSGMDFLEQAPALPRVVLTTSKTEYAFEAFQYDVIDYLKKPITMPRFRQAVEKVLESIQQGAAARAEARDIFIREDGRLVRVPFDDILYFENAGDYISIRTTYGSHLIHGAIKNVDQRLNHPLFFKVHRSYIVNLGKIKDIEDSTLVIADKVIPISRAHRRPLLDRLNLL